MFVCFYACVSAFVCVCSWGVAAQQRRIRAIAQASTSICYAVKMHKNPQTETETETGIYLNLCRYNVILHYPRKMMMASASASQLNFPPFYCGACVCVRVCRCVGVCVCATLFAVVFLCALFFFIFFFLSATDLKIFAVPHKARCQNVSSFI